MRCRTGDISEIADAGHLGFLERPKCGELGNLEFLCRVKQWSFTRRENR